MLEAVFHKRIGHMVLMMQQKKTEDAGDFFLFFFFEQIKRSCCDVSLLFVKRQNKNIQTDF